MVQELQPTGTALTAGVAGDIVDPRGLAAIAAEVAARQRSPETRRTYAAVYRGLRRLPRPRRDARDGDASGGPRLP